MSRNFLTPNLHVYKKIHSKLNLSKISHLSFAQQNHQRAQKIIQHQRAKVEALSNKVVAFKSQNRIMEESLESYDPSPELIPLQTQLALIKTQEQTINNSITNCQTVDKNSTSQQYFLWKKNQRLANHQNKINHLNAQYRNQRDYIENECSIFSEKCQALQVQIEQMEKTLTNLAAVEKYPLSKISSKNGKLNSKVNNEQEQISNICQVDLQSTKQNYTKLIEDNQLLIQNKKVMSQQLIENCGSLINSLQIYFENMKSQLINSLQKIKQEICGQEISLITTQEKQYSIDPLLNDYLLRMRYLMENSLPELKEAMQDLLTPLDWTTFNYHEFLQKDDSDINHQEEYRKKEQQYMENEQEMKILEKQIEEIDEETRNCRQKETQMQLAVNKISNIFQT